MRTPVDWRYIGECTLVLAIMWAALELSGLPQPWADCVRIPVLLWLWKRGWERRD